MGSRLRVRFWGTRGSIPVPGPTTLRCGGNTACVEIRFNGQLLVCDTGTGIRELGISLMGEAKGKPLEGDIFITHTHWDHIQGFPFFVPAYIPKNCFRIHSAKAVGDSFEGIFRKQMGLNYFPVEVADMAADLRFLHAAGDLEVGEVKVRTIFTNHPGVNVAYRFDIPDGRSVTYLTDHEKYQAFSPESELAIRQDEQIAEFCRGTDLLIADSQYTDEEYQMKRGWGHSRWKDSVQLAKDAGVKRLALFHHDPLRDDKAVEGIVEKSRALAGELKGDFEVDAAREGKEVEL